jgi:hypothetical protein
MVYTIIISELFVAAFLICIVYVPQAPEILRILGIIAAVAVPIGVFLLYKWRTRDNAASSDEMEQLVLTKAFALSGLAAISLLPVLMVLAVVFPAAAVYCVFGYALAIGGTLKVSVFILNKKY